MINVPQLRFSGASALCATLALGLAWPLMAQDSLQVTFVGDRELYLREVDKPTDSPRAVDLGIERPEIGYAPISKRTSPPPVSRTIAPIAVKMDAPLPRLYAGHARAGFGLYASPLLEVHLGDTRSRQGSWGLSFRHLSSAGSTGKGQRWSGRRLVQERRERLLQTLCQAQQRNGFCISGKGRLGIAWTGPHCSLRRAFSAPNDRQNYGTIGAALRLQNHERDSSKVHRNLALSYSRLSIGRLSNPGQPPATRHPPITWP